jgi:putative thiamine transport system substrate-binding protein
MTVLINRRHALSLAAASFALPAFAQSTAAWGDIERKARGQTVYFNAWGGGSNINAYIQWAGSEVQKRFGVTVAHVKVTDTADVVKRVRGEKAAGKLSGGTVDMVWINGENFLAMKNEGLLMGPFAEQLPAYAYVDVQGKPTTRIDFSEPVAGMEAPWGMAQLTFFVDSKRVPKPPQNPAELLAFAKAHPGRVTYPRLPDFHGTTFVKQLLLDLSPDRSALYQPVTPEALATATAPLWKYLDALHPHLWRKGKQCPQNAAAVRQMMADGELMLGITFNPNEAANEIAAKRLPTSVRSYQFKSGTIGNTHFLAVPFNANAKEGAQVFINFLMGAEAQARKADIAVWGDPTVLDVAALPPQQRAHFAAKPLAGQVLTAAPTLPEPHGSWVAPIERAWVGRYSQ